MSQTRITGLSPTGCDVKTVDELKVDVNKSPLDKPLEISSVCGKEDIVYKLIKVKKSSYGNMFIVQASNNEITAIGQGTKMSYAEKNAAINLLSQIHDNVNNTNQKPSTSNVNQLPSIKSQNSQIKIMPHKSNNSKTSSICEFNDSSSKDVEETVFYNKNSNVIMATSNISPPSSSENKYVVEKNSTSFLEMNFVGLVQEFCMTHHLQLPEYYFFQENSEQNTIIYRAMCSLLNFKTSGKGNSKQLAKRCAAYKMYLYIENLPEIEIDIFKQKPFNCCELSKVSLTSLNKPSCFPLSSKSIEHLKMFLSKNHLSYKLLVDFLDSIARDEGFVVNFIEISKKLGNCIVLVQLLADRVHVCVESRKNMIEAKSAAIHSMLVWLQFVA